MTVSGGRDGNITKSPVERLSAEQPAASAIHQYDWVLRYLHGLPLLAKQVVFVLLRQSLECHITRGTLDKFDIKNLLQLWVPRITTSGQVQLQSLQENHPQHPLAHLLRAVSKQKSFIAIALTYQWSMEQCGMLLLQALQKEWVHSPDSAITTATLLYLSGQTRLGEYLMKIGKLTAEQLDQALKTQQYAWDVMGQRTAIGNVLVNLGYVTQQDIEGILLMKQESKQQFTPKVLV